MSDGTTLAESAIKSARRVFEVLELFDRERRPLMLKEVLVALGYPASSGSALMKSLVTLGYLDYDLSRRAYFPTMRIAALGAWVQSALFPDGVLDAVMDHLRQTTGETVILAAQSDLAAQYIHVVRSAEPLQFVIPPGARRPLANSGMGWLLLSAKTDAEIERLRRRINAEAGDRPKLSQGQLMERVDEVRRRGYAFSKNNITEGAGVIGVLLPKGPFGRVFGLGIGGPVARLESHEDMIVAELRAAAARLGRT